MSRCCLTFALLALAVQLIVPASAVAQDASPTAADQPMPPGQPATGPGGSEYAFPGVRVTSLGDGPGGGRMFEPATEAAGKTPVAAGPLPLILLLDGCCSSASGSTLSGGGGDGGDGFQAWIEHLVRRGAILVYPAYLPATAEADIVATMQAALAELDAGDHAQPDPARMAVIGFSFSGPVAADYVVDAGAAGLPVPGALLVSGPAWLFPEPDRDPPPPEIRAVVFLGDYDFGATEGAQQIWDWLAPLPADQRAFVTLSSDDHGEPSLLADHFVPLTTAPKFALDALDWYGTWKLTDALMACAFAGEWCDYAFGDTPEQRFMGTWSDGVPVKEPVVTDDPATP